MKKMRISAILASTAVLLVGSVSACSSSDDSSSVDSTCTPVHADIETITEGTLTVSIPEFPPFSSYDGSDATGIDVDIVKAIAQMECLDIAYVESEYATSIPNVQNKLSDIAVGDYYRTKARAEVVDLSAPLYFDDMSITSETGITSIADLEDIGQVGTVDGYLWNDQVKEILGDKLSIYTSNALMRQDLAKGTIKAGLDSYPVAAQAIAGDDALKDTWKVEVADPDDRVDASIQPAQTTFPLTKGNTSLLDAIDADVLTLREDGTLGKIFENYGLDSSSVDITEVFPLL